MQLVQPSNLLRKSFRSRATDPARVQLSLGNNLVNSETLHEDFRLGGTALAEILEAIQALTSVHE